MVAIWALVVVIHSSRSLNFLIWKKKIYRNLGRIGNRKRFAKTFPVNGYANGYGLHTSFGLVADDTQFLVVLFVVKKGDAEALNQ